jgi:hypothetical protein
MSLRTDGKQATTVIAVRERIDIEDGGRRSLMHKVWVDGVVEHYAIVEEGAVWTLREVEEPEWLKAAETHPPQATYENSEWGDGLPGAGDKWAFVPAAERK